MEDYIPSRDGAVTAIRIYYKNNRMPMAELAFAFGGTAIIEWTNVDQRDTYKKGINGYTFIFDERERMEFSDFVKRKWQ